MSGTVAARRTGVDVALLAVAFAGLYAPLAAGLVEDWSGSGDFSHGFFVPLVSAWLLWIRRDELRAAEVRVFWPGALLLGLAIFQYSVGVAASEFYLQRTSSVVFLGGWILLLFGPRVARLCLFPVVFLLFAVPPPMLVLNWIAFPLQLQASHFTETLLGIVGVPAERSGNVIHLETVSLEVAQACSGLRSLVTLLALGAVLAEGSLLPGPRRPHGILPRTVLFLAAVPVAVFVNSLRVAATAVVAAKGGLVVTSGWVHEMAGLVMFALSLALLLLWRFVLRWLESSWPGSRPAS